jgi:hypothetical protein
VKARVRVRLGIGLGLRFRVRVKVRVRVKDLTLNSRPGTAYAAKCTPHLPSGSFLGNEQISVSWK